MVDVGDKQVTERSATAEGFVRVSHELARQIRGNLLRKGSVLETARLAGIMGAKRTSELVPLCHPISLDVVEVEARLRGGRVHVTARARTHARTGVEMEALSAVLAACLTIIDMGKSVDRGMVIEGVSVVEKRGGRSGRYVAAGQRAGRRSS